MFAAVRTRPALLLWAVLLFAGTLTLNLRHRDFAWYYHPDEPGKIEQVLTEKWNFHHPMLLLRVSRIVMEMAGVAHESQAVVEAGRAVSAGFGALAVVALSLLAYYWRGWLTAFAAGGALAFHHQLFELSHYMKEDTALLLGMALVWLAMIVFEKAPSIGGAAAMGAACGLAISGKYIGAIALFSAVPTLWRAGGKLRAAAFVGALFAVLIAVNWPLLADVQTFRQSLARETGFVVSGQKTSTRSVPHARSWNVFVDNTNPVIWLLLAAFLVGRWRSRRNVTPARWHLIAFPFLYALALSFSPKSNDRYFLPATAAFTLLAALGVTDAQRFLQFRWSGVAVATCLVLAQFNSWLRYDRAFRRDDSRELLEWCRTELPPDAVISKDSRIWLPDAAKPDTVPATAIPQRVEAEKFAADVGTLEQQRAKGITHVAISESDYGRFFLRSLQPKAGKEAEFKKRKSFYESLLRDGELLFERERGTVIYLHPGIRVYRIAR